MELLQRFASGDLEAFEVLFREHQADVYRWILRIVRHTATAEDLTVETFWRFYKARSRFDPGRGNCGAWLRRIGTNAAMDHLRKARREVPLAEDLPSAAGIGPCEQEELRAQLQSAVNGLTPRLRITVMLALVEEEPYENIAQALGISVSAVKVRVFRGVRILRKKLTEVGVHS
jgi:RNA polymerase sigma-70 factor (ECF subfamily)